jgi:hypothetical protein
VWLANGWPLRQSAQNMADAQNAKDGGQASHRNLFKVSALKQRDYEKATGL